MMLRVGRTVVAASLVSACLAGAPVAGMAQSTTNNTTVKPNAARTARAAHAGSVTGQQHSQPSPNQNQPQAQTDNSQQPPNATTLPPTAGSQNQPNPLPQLAR